VQPLLVLWDVDYTLIAADGTGEQLYDRALGELYGLRMPPMVRSMAGRTDSAITLEVLTLAGVPDPEGEIPRFQSVLATYASDLEEMIRARGRVLPGAAEALAALADARHADLVIQSLLTGNIPAIASVKLGAFDLARHVDLTVGAYGDTSQIRSDLVAVARQNAAARYGTQFAGRATVLVGDTPSDVEAAALTGARAVAVATGRFTVAELLDAGADVALPDLSDTEKVVAAIVADRP